MKRFYGSLTKPQTISLGTRTEMSLKMSEATPVLCEVRRKLKKKMTDCPKDQFLREKYKIINRAY